MLAQLAEHADKVGFNGDSSAPNSFSIERHKEGMKAYSGQMFLEIDEIGNLMGRSKDIHEVRKEIISAKDKDMNNSRIVNKEKDGKNTLNDKLLTSIEDLLKDSAKPEKDSMRPMRFAQTGDKTKLKGAEDIFGGDEDSSPFTENEGGGDAASQAAKALAEQMKQYQNTEFYETKSVKDFDYSTEQIVKFNKTTDKLTTNYKKLEKSNKPNKDTFNK